MDTDAAFLRSIEADLADTVPMLIYADWLNGFAFSGGVLKTSQGVSCGARVEVSVQRSRVAVGDDVGVWVYTLHVGDLPLTAESARAIPEQPLGAEPLGSVTLHREDCATLGTHLHLLWVNAEGQLRMSTIAPEPRWAVLPHLYLGD